MINSYVEDPAWTSIKKIDKIFSILYVELDKLFYSKITLSMLKEISNKYGNSKSIKNARKESF